MEGGMDNRTHTNSKVAVDMNRLLATHTTKIAGRGLMEDGSNTDKVRIHPMLVI